MDKPSGSHGSGDQPPQKPAPFESKEADGTDFEYVVNTELSPPEAPEALSPATPASVSPSSSNENQDVGQGLGPADMPLIECPSIELRPTPGRPNIRSDLHELSSGSGDFVMPLQQDDYSTDVDAGVGEPILVIKPAASVFHDYDDEEDEDVLSQSSERDASPKESIESLLTPESNLMKPSNTSLTEDLLLDAGQMSIHGEDGESSKQTLDSSHLDDFKEAVEEEVCEPTEPVRGVIDDETKELPIDLFCKMGLGPEED